MVLDGITVLFDTAMMAATVGGILLFAGTRRAGDRSLCLWGVGYIAASIATVLFTQRTRIDDLWTIDVANASFALAYGMFWAGARRFGGRPVTLSVVMLGAVLWLLACRFDAFHASVAARLIFSSVAAAAYLLATAWTLFRISEKLPSKNMLIAVLCLHAVFYIVRVPGAFLSPPQSGANIVLSPLFFAVAIEGLFHLVASSILLVTMSKERSENGVQRLASIDALTGIDNRRSFLARATWLLHETRQKSQPVSVLMIDIDHFKGINDSRGHQGGDEVLRAFAKTLRDYLRPADLCGRLGGEEFACLLTNCSDAQGSLVAERLREAVNEAQPGVTVSIGVASASNDGITADLHGLMNLADQALYAAKGQGRNRVTLAAAA